MSYAGRSSVLRFMVVVGTTYTAALVVRATTHASAGRSGDGNGLNCCVEKETENEKRSLRDAQDEMFRDQTRASLHGDHGWHPLQDRMGPTDHSHESMHMHNRHSYKNAYDYKNDDDEDSGDNNSDDEKDDDEKDDDKNDDGNDDDDEDDGKDDNKDDSAHNSQGASSSDRKSQSSVLTDLDGVNIGNTIMIVNIGTVSQQPGNNGLSGNAPNGNVLVPDDTGHAALTFAARAFCDSVGCNSSQGSPSIDANSSSMTLPPTTLAVAASNATRNNDVRCGPVVSNGSSRVTIGLVKWLLLVAILIELLRF